MFARSFVCILLHFVVQSASICVQEYGTDSICTESLILLVPRSRLEETNGYGLLVKNFSSVQSSNINSETTSHFTAKIGNTTKQYDLTQKVPIPSDIGSGSLTISLNYVSITDTLIQCTNEPPDSYFVTVQSQYLITLQIFDDPVLHYRENPDILECQFNHSISSALIEFKLNDDVLGYCGSYMVRPLDDTSKGISIYYDATSDVCALQINAVIDANIRIYSCSVMIPYPTGNAFLKLNSSLFTQALSPSPTLSPSPNTGSKSTTIGIVLGIIATIVVIAVIISVILVLLHKKKNCCTCTSNADLEPEGNSESTRASLIENDKTKSTTSTVSQPNDMK